MLSAEQIRRFRQSGHLTVAEVFQAAEVRQMLADVEDWSQQFVRELTPEQRSWYAEKQSGSQTVLRKLDHPVFHRDVFRKFAASPKLVGMVEQLIGPGVNVFFSQVFMKPPEVGGPKPIHQDNFYFGPDHIDATLTAWIALDEATIENGCLHYGEVHQPEVVPHIAPPDEPFNLQIPAEIAARYQLVPAPVPRGGVSFHHGNTPHQSSANRSQQARRAAAFHYLRNDAKLTHPALDYDPDFRVTIT
ncbi:MAG: phytanoyl-CoA dioxygenase family protein [Pirellulales bacterium]|nr:phytanoyl-CoA dioxygenase family protein [Pirellulales bacterium]